MTEPVLILTMKWGTLYGADDVNRLFRQVRRHLARPHRFVCFTDDAQGLDPGVEALPLPELGLPKGHGDTRWRKLALFRRDLGGFAGMTALFLDLDLVVVDDLEPFFDLPGEFFIIRDDDLFRPKPLRKVNPTRDRFLHSVGNSSVFRYRVGAHSYVLDAYLADPAAAAEGYEHEQQFLSGELLKRGLMQYWPKGLCVSFKNDCVPRNFRSYFRNPVLPMGARIVLFAGAPKMDDVFSGRGNKWYRRIGDIEWLRTAWTAD
ncbi:hypothetical protein SAMN04488021_10154 [Paracoccus aminovorans]|uniref:Glycosyltransferase n=1 Tax=Paracoccus aminovorans TaxID=34004 RepID=A0A1I2X4V9_9RHOB|nr:hypothetical protein [Paracoccus aminovorans]CQR85477.1 hypothetical protein JCM7685_0899 [Paracoccus aminovorans]SFH07969.1 hypothetical protein SAMN04488021_10154 [Paracoccus aminovorans]